MKEDYDTFPYFYATPHCNCGRILKQHKTPWDLNLQKESELKVRVEGRCDGCKQNYNFVMKIYGGADGEKYLGQFDASEMVTTISGALTVSGNWNRNKIIQYNKSVGQLKRGVALKNEHKIINKKPF
ncbi:MAG TPA: hypothetical protein VJC20_00615 [Candidatus Paceibacterota bacterium]